MSEFLTLTVLLRPDLFDTSEACNMLFGTFSNHAGNMNHWVL